MMLNFSQRLVNVIGNVMQNLKLINWALEVKILQTPIFHY